MIYYIKKEENGLISLLCRVHWCSEFTDHLEF